MGFYVLTEVIASHEAFRAFLTDEAFLSSVSAYVTLKFI